MEHVLNIVKSIKEGTGRMLAATLAKQAGAVLSEKDLAESWLAVLRENPDLWPSGWYDPPPGGVICLSGKPDAYERVCAAEVRSEPMWPKKDIAIEDEDILMIYASPVHRKTSIIGDFGCSLYRGGRADIRDHFRRVLESTLHIAQQAEPGMAFQDLYAIAMDHVAGRGFVNAIESGTDKTGTNIGHTIPLSYISDETRKAIEKARSFADIRESLRVGRKFINSAESLRIENDMAFTIEPRLSTAVMPKAFFHVTVVFEGGKRQICHGLAPIFQQYGMDNLLPLLP